MVASESAPVGEPVLNYGRPEETDDVDASASETEEPPADDPAAADPGQQPDDSVTGTVTDESAPLATEEVSDEIVDAFSDGWFSDPGANGQVALWGIVLALVSIGAYLISRRLRRDWAGALIGIMPFVVALYFFFQNVNRLLPPNL